jgi:hypothetical protein
MTLAVTLRPPELLICHVYRHLVIVDFLYSLDLIFSVFAGLTSTTLRRARECLGDWANGRWRHFRTGRLEILSVTWSMRLVSTYQNGLLRGLINEDLA